MRWGSACVVVFLCVGATAVAEDRTVFSFRDAENRRGCFFELDGKEWVELTGKGKRFAFKEIDCRKKSITLFDQSRGGVTVRLYADEAEQKAHDAVGEKGEKWALLGHGSWATRADLRAELRERGLRPVWQGRRGTCSVFTTTSALEFAFSRCLGKNVRLSVEYLNWAANQATGHATDGQYFHNCLAGFAKYGICYNADMSYARRFDAERAPSPKAIADARQLRATADKAIRVDWIKRLWPRRKMTDGQFHEIRAVLAMGWPVAAGASHSRLLVGFRDDPKEPGGGIFIDKDSGTGSYRQVTYQFVKRNVADVFWVEALAQAQ
jgi:hypothetical protein